MTDQLKSDGPYQDAQLSEELARYVMGSEPFKTPAEWWARGEIESLRARIAELEAANVTLREALKGEKAS